MVDRHARVKRTAAVSVVEWVCERASACMYVTEARSMCVRTRFYVTVCV